MILLVSGEPLGREMVNSVKNYGPIKEILKTSEFQRKERCIVADELHLVDDWLVVF